MTSDHIEGKNITKTLGMVKGSTVRARHLGRDLTAGLRGIVGGEITECTKLMAEVREEAIYRMEEQAEKMDANAILYTRLMTSMVMSGTAVVVE